MNRLRFVWIFALAPLFGASVPVNLADVTRWLPVTDEERNLQAPTIDPQAGAEALFWRVHIVQATHAQDRTRKSSRGHTV